MLHISGTSLRWSVQADHAQKEGLEIMHASTADPVHPLPLLHSTLPPCSVSMVVVPALVGHLMDTSMSESCTVTECFTAFLQQHALVKLD